MTKFTISYEGIKPKPFKLVERDEAIELSDRKNFICFQVQCLPKKDHRTGQLGFGRDTKIRMVNINKGLKTVEYRNWNG